MNVCVCVCRMRNGSSERLNADRNSTQTLHTSRIKTKKNNGNYTNTTMLLRRDTGVEVNAVFVARSISNRKEKYPVGKIMGKKKFRVALSSGCSADAGAGVIDSQFNSF